MPTSRFSSDLKGSAWREPPSARSSSSFSARRPDTFVPTNRVEYSQPARAAAALSAHLSSISGDISPRQTVQRTSFSLLRPSLSRADRKEGARSSSKDMSPSAEACMARTVFIDRPRSALVRPVASMANCLPRQLSQMGPRRTILLAVSRISSLGFSMISSLIMTLLFRRDRATGLLDLATCQSRNGLFSRPFSRISAWCKQIHGNRAHRES